VVVAVIVLEVDSVLVRRWWDGRVGENDDGGTLLALLLVVEVSMLATDDMIWVDLVWRDVDERNCLVVVEVVIDVGKPFTYPFLRLLLPLNGIISLIVVVVHVVQTRQTDDPRGGLLLSARSSDVELIE
jgi:hypothetical protein